MGFSSCCVVSGAYYLVQNHGSQTDITQTSNVSWNIRKTRYIRRDYSQKWDILGTPFFLGIITNNWTIGLVLGNGKTGK